MKKSILTNLFISTIIILPLILKTLKLNYPFVNGLADSINIIFSILIIMNLFGLVALQTIKKFSTYIDTKDLLAENETQKKIENHISYKIYKTVTLSLIFGLLIYNQMHLTTIFACVWWLSNHFFKINFDKFTKEIE